jgi:hypothetical protein
VAAIGTKAMLVATRVFKSLDIIIVSPCFIIQNQTPQNP